MREQSFEALVPGLGKDVLTVSCVEARSLVPVRKTVEIKSWYQNSFLATKAWRSGKSIVRNNVLKQYQRL